LTKPCLLRAVSSALSEPADSVVVSERPRRAAALAAVRDALAWVVTGLRFLRATEFAAEREALAAVVRVL